MVCPFVSLAFPSKSRHVQILSEIYTFLMILRSRIERKEIKKKVIVDLCIIRTPAYEGLDLTQGWDEVKPEVRP